MTAEVHGILVWVEIGLALVTVVSLLWIAAPYGRHMRAGWGPTIPSRWGWILMESPTLGLFLPLYFQGERAAEPGPLVLLCLWLSHYVHRTLFFPFQIRGGQKGFPLSVAVLGVMFNCLNASVIAPQLSAFGDYPPSWLTDPRFVIGVILFVVGYAINRDADRTLISLRAGEDQGYSIPRGRLYEWISCPNYLGEIVEWTGFAIATWSLAGLAFAIYTVANVGPRALTHHRWYREQFPNYPEKRKALIPFVI